MHVSVYSRHTPSCPKIDDPHWRRCRCPKWHYCIDWQPDPRRSARTRSWDEAEQRARAIESGEQLRESQMSVATAASNYVSDMKDRSLSDDYRAKVKRELDELVEFCRVKPVRSLAALTLEALGEHRRNWKGGATTRSKRQERLRSFFLYCQRHKWISDNPAIGLSRIKLTAAPTIPLTKEQFDKCVRAATPRTASMLLLLRWSGLRITDAATLERKRLVGNKLLLYTQKTGTPVYVPLPPKVAERLHALKNENKQYFFWSGGSRRSSAGIRWWENLKVAFKAAGFPELHPHQLRDTFAVEMLLAGVPLDQVSILLGHSSIKVTERSYSPWIKARQEQLEASVMKAW